MFKTKGTMENRIKNVKKKCRYEVYGWMENGVDAALLEVFSFKLEIFTYFFIILSRYLINCL
ncbi:hypothetical protein D7Z54_27180 [Salibacterium salarium]|uniref:Uncharacterized protein n=1 Tax=Salibacterium salarium TaxID=284579 RepID=A0A3R9QGR8_9BACI|nr:hypothetical protein D7Z54_27180 [Salibacterium salarium]